MRLQQGLAPWKASLDIENKKNYCWNTVWIERRRRQNWNWNNHKSIQKSAFGPFPHDFTFERKVFNVSMDEFINHPPLSLPLYHPLPLKMMFTEISTVLWALSLSLSASLCVSVFMCVFYIWASIFNGPLNFIWLCFLWQLWLAL